MRRYVPWYAFGRVLDVTGPECVRQRWMDCETACYLDDGHEGVWGRYPLVGYPCVRCEREALPHLVDNGAEFYWEHQHYETGMSSARSGCPRFNDRDGFQAKPRKKTAVATHCRREMRP